METEKRLRKDLKRTKALLVDAQIMLDHIKNNAPSKREIAQLKNQVRVHLDAGPGPLMSGSSSDSGVCFFPIMQLEESEFTCAAAVKARKSMEVEIEDLHVQMEDMSKAKQAVSPTVPPSWQPFPWQPGPAPFIHLPFPWPFGPAQSRPGGIPPPAAFRGNESAAQTIPV